MNEEFTNYSRKSFRKIKINEAKANSKVRKIYLKLFWSFSQNL